MVAISIIRLALKRRSRHISLEGRVEQQQPSGVLAAEAQLRSSRIAAGQSRLRAQQYETLKPMFRFYQFHDAQGTLDAAAVERHLELFYDTHYFDVKRGVFWMVWASLFTNRTIGNCYAYMRHLLEKEVLSPEDGGYRAVLQKIMQDNRKLRNVAECLDNTIGFYLSMAKH